MKRPSSRFSPLQLFVGLISIIAISEAAIMAVLPWLVDAEEHGHLTEALVDTALLSLICAPFLWYWLFHPLQEAYESASAESHAIIESAGEAIISINEQGIIETFNPAAEHIFGYSASEAIGKNVSFLMPEPYRKQHNQFVQRYLDTHITRVIGSKRQLEGLRANGEVFPLELAVSEVRRGRRRTFTAVLHDISAYKTAETRLSEANSLLEKIFSNLPGMIAYLDNNFNFIRVNRNYAEADNRAADFFVGKNYFDLYPDDENRPVFETVRQSGTPHFAHARAFEHKDHPERGVSYQDWVLHPIIDEQGEVSNLLLTMSDVTGRAMAEIQRREATKKLEYMVHHDTLTGLPNRLLFYDRLERAVHLARRNNDRICLFFVDLDLFKQVNDNFGHAAGDELLCQVSQRLKNSVRESDSVARIAGDEFTVILQQVRDCDAAIQIAQKIIDGLRQPFQLNGHTAQIGASIGIAIYPLDATTADDMVKAADTAMYAAKRAGRNTFVCSMGET